MNGLVISIGWEYFLGLIAGVLGVAWYSGARFTKVETSIEWLKEGLRDLKVELDNKKIEAFAARSPIALTPTGRRFLEDSGLKAYIDDRAASLLKPCRNAKKTTAYEVQMLVFDLFDTLPFEKAFDMQLKQYAYEQGITIEMLRRIGAIYFRDICLGEFSMNPEDLDKGK